MCKINRIDKGVGGMDRRGEEKFCEGPGGESEFFSNSHFFLPVIFPQIMGSFMSLGTKASVLLL